MRSLIRFDRRLVSLLAGGCLLCSCDPEGPGAEGTLSLDPAVDATGFATLQIRVYPDDSATFDASKITSEAETQLSLATSGVTFPYHYNVGQVLGTTEQERWRMAAWLSHDTDSPAKPADGDPMCSANFDIKSCGASGGYCTVTKNIDCTLK